MVAAGENIGPCRASAGPATIGGAATDIGDPHLRRELLERHIPWPRDRHWRPGEPITLTDDDGMTVTYRLRGVMRDTDPSSAHATVSLEPIRTMSADLDADDLLAAG